MERSALEEATESVGRTLAAGSVRIRASYEMDAALPDSQPRRRGGLLRPFVKKLARAAGRWAWEYVGRNWTSFSYEGFIEPSRRRHMVASDGWRMAELERDGERFSGRAGQPVATLQPVRGRGFVDIWFLLDALRGLTAATPEGDDVIRGTPCSRLAARVDLQRASAATPDGIHPPDVDRFEDLLDLPLTVWIDGTHVRRVRFEEEQPSRSWSLELWDFGVSTDGLDWSRLPNPEPSDAEAGGSSGRRLLERVRGRGERRSAF